MIGRNREHHSVVVTLGRYQLEVWRDRERRKFGWSFGQKGDPFQYRLDYANAMLTKDPNDIYAHWSIGNLHSYIGDLQTARHHWQRVIDLDVEGTLSDGLRIQLLARNKDDGAGLIWPDRS
jgi:hypothetical protein